jgi:hypothetical protein
VRRFNRLYKIIMSKTPKKIDPEEVSEVKWQNIAEVKKLIKEQPGQITDGLKDVMARYY